MRFLSLPAYLLVFAALATFTRPAAGQKTADHASRAGAIEQGSVLAGFSLEGVRASRDDFHHEFERAFSQLRGNLEGLYFFSNQFGIGPILGYEYLFRDFEDPTGYSDPPDRWNWRVLYGAKAGWYIPLRKLFSTGAENTYLFLYSGVSWRQDRQKIENIGTLPSDNHFGYHLGTGLMVPVGARIYLEWKLGWEAQREEQQARIIDSNQEERVLEETHWLKELSAGLGLKVIF